MWNNSGHQEYNFGLISAEEAAMVKREIGLNLSDFSRYMATRGVRHVKNNHSDRERECLQQQPPVKPSDFALIPQIAKTGTVTKIGRSGSRKPMRLEHRVTIDNRVYVYIETIGANDKRLELWTMRIENVNKGKF
jgi:hypothetical protein